MDFDTLTRLTRPRLRVRISRKDNSVEPFARNVLTGLSAKPKRISPKYFYDEIGSNFFEQICELPEYYPTRTERSIIERYSKEIVELAGNSVLIELGSGSSSKTCEIIEAFLMNYDKLHYIPIDISGDILVGSAKALLRQYPNLRITALVSDYGTALTTLRRKSMPRKLILFLGSSIGNFAKEEAISFLIKLRDSMNECDSLLIGMDLVKDRDLLLPAYDDSQGITAQFNLNLLLRMNHELGADFDLDKFGHKVIFNKKHSRVEMHIESTEAQSVKIEQFDRVFVFKNGETIHTENSHKFTKVQIKEMAARCGFELQHAWYDDQDWFSLNLMRPS